MSRIVTAVNVMVSNPPLISSVIKGASETNELFFIYGNKHAWSLRTSKEGDFLLEYYPSGQDINDLAQIPDEDWHQHGINSVSYSTKELATKESKESFKELYSLLSEKTYGMEDVLSDIIGNEPF